jgi:DNA-directed RNA polymerase subunit H
LSDKAIHDFVPVHQLLDDKESKKVFEELNLRGENLPKMLSTDPQAIRLNAKPGSVIMVKRSDQGNNYTYYRFVVEG